MVTPFPPHSTKSIADPVRMSPLRVFCISDIGLQNDDIAFKTLRVRRPPNFMMTPSAIRWSNGILSQEPT
jgi:hypothetical protein